MTKEEVRQRIVLMRRTWGMWAVTREGYIMQIAMMLYIVYGIDPRPWERALVRNNRPDDLAEPIDQAFAEKACDSALKLTSP